MDYLNTNYYLYLILLVVFLKLVLVIYLLEGLDFIEKFFICMAIDLDWIADLIADYVLAYELYGLANMSILFWRII
jgi:hypothetical protein